MGIMQETRREGRNYALKNLRAGAVTMLEHPDVRSAERTGWPCGAAQENRDRPEYRREFVEDNIEKFVSFVARSGREAIDEFIRYAVDGDPDVIDRFVAHYPWKYRDFLN